MYVFVFLFLFFIICFSFFVCGEHFESGSIHKNVLYDYPGEFKGVIPFYNVSIGDRATIFFPFNVVDKKHIDKRDVVIIDSNKNEERMLFMTDYDVFEYYFHVYNPSPSLLHNTDGCLSCKSLFLYDENTTIKHLRNFFLNVFEREIKHIKKDSDNEMARALLLSQIIKSKNLICKDAVNIFSDILREKNICVYAASGFVLKNPSNPTTEGHVFALMSFRNQIVVVDPALVRFPADSSYIIYSLDCFSNTTLSIGYKKTKKNMYFGDIRFSPFNTNKCTYIIRGLDKIENNCSYTVYDLCNITFLNGSYEYFFIETPPKTNYSFEELIKRNFNLSQIKYIKCFSSKVFIILQKEKNLSLHKCVDCIKQNASFLNNNTDFFYFSNESIFVFHNITGFVVHNESGLFSFNETNVVSSNNTDLNLQVENTSFLIEKKDEFIVEQKQTGASHDDHSFLKSREKEKNDTSTHFVVYSTPPDDGLWIFIFAFAFICVLLLFLKNKFS